MIKINIFFLIVFFTYSCTNIEDNKRVKLDSVMYYKSSLFDTKIVFLNIEDNTEMNVIPHFIIDNEVIDGLVLRNYIKNRSVETRGEKQVLKTGFSVIKEYNINQLDYLITVIQKYIIDLHPEFRGTLEIVIKYSSKGNDWLKLPPPPKLVMPQS